MRVMTLGTFDMFHAGHVELLRGCYELSLKWPPFTRKPEVIVGLNTDAFVEGYKGQAPVIPWEQRAEVVRACRYVNRVIANPLMERPQSYGIAMIDPDVIAVGSDWENRDYLGQLGIDQAWLNDHDIHIVYSPRPHPPRISSTLIKQHLTQQSS